LLKSAVGGVRTVNYRPDLETGRHTTVDGEKFFNTYEHAIRLPNWRSTRAHGISTDQANADGATELLRDKDPYSRTDVVEQLISFSELATELLGSRSGSPPM